MNEELQASAYGTEEEMYGSEPDFEDDDHEELEDHYWNAEADQNEAHVDPTMVITDTELGWALALKIAVTENDELDNLCDMEYAHHAIIAQGNLQEALTRVERMQIFRQHYKVDNSLEQGLYFIQELMKQQPGFLMNIDIDLVRQESLNVFDCGCFQPNVALDTTASPEIGIRDNWKIFACAAYYVKYTSQPTLAVIRNGLLELADFGEYGWKNFSTETNQRLMDEVISYYPMKWNGLLMYNTVPAANVIMSMCKPLMGDSMRNALRLGCQFVESDGSHNCNRRLREFYLQPNQEEAEANLLERARLLLSTRCHNETTFRLG